MRFFKEIKKTDLNEKKLKNVQLKHTESNQNKTSGISEKKLMDLDKINIWIFES